MDDRELLELAAKAVGLVGVWHERGQCIHVTDCAGMSDIWWRPHEDDGDALRLAERCSLTVCMNGTGTVSACDEYRKSDVFVTQSIHECGGSRITATRRAIVRAAAEIGKVANE